MAEITGVFARHGAASAVAPLGRWWPGRFQSPPEHLRLALEELGTTFVKIGQILSTRADILPPAYQAELARLQDGAPPEPAAAIRAVIAAELGRPVEEAFSSFCPEPLASASIGQAHVATTGDGVEVVVKVRRPAVVEQVERDLVLLERMAAWAGRHSEHARRNDVVALAHEFATTLRSELDYLREAANAERFAAAFAGDPGVHIPVVVWELTTSRVLTLERIRGLKVTDTAGLAAAGVDRAELARRAATIEMRMVFEDGFFHADPHPGNFFIEPDGHIGLIDFGMVGTVDATTRLALVRVMGALATRDGDGLVDAFLDLGIAGTVVDRADLRADLLALASTMLDHPLGEMSLAALLHDLLAVVRSHRLRLPANLALLAKTIGMCEGVGAQLDPDFRLTSVLLPFVQRLLTATSDPGGADLGPAAPEAPQPATP